MYDYKPTYIDKNDKNLETLLNDNIIIHKEIYDEINTYKQKIDNISKYKWTLIRSIQTDYEYIGNNKLHNIKRLKSIKSISRAYYKLWELISQYNIQDLQNKKNMRFACLAEAPGGFVKCLIDYRRKFGYSNDNITGISLKDPNTKKNIKWNLNNNNFKVIYGDPNTNHNGNLYNPEIIDYYCNYYSKMKANFVTADGGFCVDTIQENQKGQYHNHLFMSEIYIALKILKRGGNFVIKIYDTCNKVLVDFVVVLKSMFKKVDIVKPKTSREMNSENYIVCLNYKNNNKHIVNNMRKTLEHMWDNKNLMLYGLVKTNNNKIENFVKRVSSKTMKLQRDKLGYAVNTFRYKLSSDITNILNEKHDEKIKNANEWLEMYYF